MDATNRAAKKLFWVALFLGACGGADAPGDVTEIDDVDLRDDQGVGVRGIQGSGLHGIQGSGFRAQGIEGSGVRSASKGAARAK